MASRISSDFSQKNLLLAVASAAHAASNLEEEEAERTRAAAKEAEPVNPNTTPEGRLAAVLEVNRVLRGALTEKKSLLSQSKEEVKRLGILLERGEVEEPNRAASIEQLQARVRTSERSGGASREATQMTREIRKLEAKIGDVNAENLILSDKHRLDRTRMAEQQGRLRTIGKRERELARHLDNFATKLNEACESFRLYDSAGECLYTGMSKLPKDFRNLDGICLGKLVGQNPDRAPPSLVLAPGTSVPTLAPAAELGFSAAGDSADAMEVAASGSIKEGSSTADVAGSVAPA